MSIAQCEHKVPIMNRKGELNYCGKCEAAARARAEAERRRGEDDKKK